MTLFERLGGAEGVRRVVDELTTRLEADPGLAPLFAGVDGDGLRRHRERYLAAVLGGPEQYTGRGLREAHRPLGIDDAQFDRFLGLVLESARAVGTAPFGIRRTSTGHGRRRPPAPETALRTAPTGRWPGMTAASNPCGKSARTVPRSHRAAPPPGRVRFGNRRSTCVDPTGKFPLPLLRSLPYNWSRQDTPGILLAAAGYRRMAAHATTGSR